MPLVQKGNSGQIHNGRFCHQVCVHSLHTSGIQDLGEPHDPSSPSNPFSNPDVPSEEIDDPGQDDDPSPGPDPTAEPIRVQRKRRQISVDSTDALPKAKAKVIIKRANVQLPGHVVMYNQCQFLLLSMMKKMKDLHMTLKPLVQGSLHSFAEGYTHITCAR